MNKFKLVQPRNYAQAAAYFASGKGGGQILAGGTDLLEMLKSGVMQPEFVIDLGTAPDLVYVKESTAGFHIGAMTTLTDLAADKNIRTVFPGLYAAVNSVASPQLRNIGTIGGNLNQRPRCWYFRDPEIKCRKKGGSRCFAFRGRNKYHAVIGGRMCYIVHPSDLAPVLISLNAQLTILARNQEKVIPIAEFFTPPSVDVKRENVLQPGELVKEIRLPRPQNGMASAYYKFMERGSWDFAIVSAAVSGVRRENTFSDLSIVMGGIAPIPWPLTAVEKQLVGKMIETDNIRQLVRAALKEARPLAENAYKLELAEVVVVRALERLSSV